MTPFSFITDIIERWRFGDMCRPGAALPASPEPAPTPTAPVSRPRTITRVGAWAGASLVADPLRNVLAAGAARIDELHFMVADHSAWRSEHAFSDRPAKGRRAASLVDLVRIGRLCAEHQISLALTTWVMPHEKYAEGCAGYLLDAVRVLDEEGVSITSIIFDAEEPWTQAVNVTPRRRNAVAALLRSMLDPLRQRPHEVRLGLTGIGYAPEAKLDPLAEICDFAVPQVYPTKNGTLDPSTAPMKFARHWTRLFERKQLALALPAFKQAPGMMAAALAGAREVAQDTNTAECSEVIYWSLPHIRASAAKTRFVAGIKAVA